MLIRQKGGLAGNGNGRFSHEKARIRTSGFHSSSKQKESFMDAGRKKTGEIPADNALTGGDRGEGTTNFESQLGLPLDAELTSTSVSLPALPVFKELERGFCYCG